MQLVSPPHSENLRHHRKMDGPGTFFVTKCLDPRNEVITDEIAAVICDALCFYSDKHYIYLGAFAVMRDHWHGVLAPADEKGISYRMQILDRWVSSQTNQELSRMGTQWQDGYYETLIRSAKQFQYVCAYIELNSVRAGLVNSPSDWLWSSANSRYREWLTAPWPWRFPKEG
jgi:REP element-mobilizing transposase RayT